MNTPRPTLLAQALLASTLALISALARAEPMTVLRTTELKADHFLDASTLGQLTAGQTVDTLAIAAVELPLSDKARTQPR